MITNPINSKSDGFTLIEIMVVIVLITVLSSTVMLSVASQKQRTNQADVQRLQNHLEQAWLWSELANQSTRIRFMEQRYQIQNWSKTSWRESPGLKVSGTHELHPDISITPFIQLSDTSDLLFFAGGEYSPFKIEISTEDKNYSISGDGNSTPILASD